MYAKYLKYNQKLKLNPSVKDTELTNPKHNTLRVAYDLQRNDSN